jgi:hypothetical protein
MTKKSWFRASLPAVTAALLATTLAGCTSTASTASQTSGYEGTPSAPAVSQAANKPVPRVQDCGVLNTGTPSRFVCNGKVYTSFQLAKLREDEAKRYAAGK